jgi:hypothetical protein
MMLWSCLTTKGVGNLYKIEQTLNIVYYLELLQEELYTTLIDFDLDLDEVIFQQDNATAHKANLYRDGSGSNYTLLWTSLLNH